MATPVTPEKLHLMKLAAQKRVEAFRLEATRLRLKECEMQKARKLLAQASSHFNAMKVTLAIVQIRVDADVITITKTAEWLKKTVETPEVRIIPAPQLQEL